MTVEPLKVKEVPCETQDEVKFRLELSEGVEISQSDLDSIVRLMGAIRDTYLKYEKGELYLYGPKRAYDP